MKNKLHQLLESKPSKLLMTHLVAGYPTLEKSASIASTMITSGADILELQIPFSDPMADGPTIAAACTVATQHAPAPEHTFRLTKTLSAEYRTTPLVVMCYANSIYQYGITRFVADAGNHGVDGLIVPDMPLDTTEGKELLAAATMSGICIIPVVSPGVSSARLKQILPLGSGFVYCTSRQGTTGTQSTLDIVKKYAQTLKRMTRLPIAIGFGIRTMSDVQTVHTFSPIAIAGSVFIKAIESNPENAAIAVHKLTQDLKKI
jgi:tryptophan synthase alpha chain